MHDLFSITNWQKAKKPVHFCRLYHLACNVQCWTMRNPRWWNWKSLFFKLPLHNLLPVFILRPPFLIIIVKRIFRKETLTQPCYVSIFHFQRHWVEPWVSESKDSQPHVFPVVAALDFYGSMCFSPLFISLLRRNHCIGFPKYGQRDPKQTSKDFRYRACSMLRITIFHSCTEKEAILVR